LVLQRVRASEDHHVDAASTRLGSQCCEFWPIFYTAFLQPIDNAGVLYGRRGQVLYLEPVDRPDWSSDEKVVNRDVLADISEKMHALPKGNAMS